MGVQDAMPLGALEIDTIVERYRREIARYEETAHLIEARLRRATRDATIQVLLSSRAKHPEDLRKKIEAKNKKGDPRYTFEALNEDVNQVVTDLAGCRVMAYQQSDVENITRAVLDSFHLAPVENANEKHDKTSGYRANHLLVIVPPDEERISLRNTICEVQIASLASHISTSASMIFDTRNMVYHQELEK